MKRKDNREPFKSWLNRKYPNAGSMLDKINQFSTASGVGASTILAWVYKPNRRPRNYVRHNLTGSFMDCDYFKD